MFGKPATTAAPGHRLSLAALAAAAVLVASNAAAAVDVRFGATDVADLISGQDLWRYDYSVLGGLGDGEVVNVLFNPADYSQLLVTATDARLLGLVTEPLPTLPAAGTLMLLPVGAIAAADPAPTASLQFVWMGAGAPGAQSFEHLNAAFNVVATGMTSPVPEAGSAAMLAAGLTGLAWAVRRRRALS